MDTEQIFLNELGANSLYDYYFHEQFGTSSDHLIKHFGWKDRVKRMINGEMLIGGEYQATCKIYYFHITFLDLMIRFPAVATLCVIGIIIGLKGFISFRKYSLRLALSFMFYSCMNLTGLLFHSLIPIQASYRLLFMLGDKASTFLSGLFLCFVLLHIQKYPIYSVENTYIPSVKAIVIYIALIIVTFVLCGDKKIGDIMYVLGCDAVFYSGVRIFICAMKGDAINANVYKIGQWSVAILICFVFTVTSHGSLCRYNLALNPMTILFTITHIGFIAVYYYIGRYYDTNTLEKKTQ